MRKALGIPVRWLRIEECTITKEWVENLSEVVDTLVWDDDWGSLVDDDGSLPSHDSREVYSEDSEDDQSDFSELSAEEVRS